MMSPHEMTMGALRFRDPVTGIRTSFPIKGARPEPEDCFAPIPSAIRARTRLRAIIGQDRDAWPAMALRVVAIDIVDREGNKLRVPLPSYTTRKGVLEAIDWLKSRGYEAKPFARYMRVR